MTFATEIIPKLSKSTFATEKRTSISKLGEELPVARAIAPNGWTVEAAGDLLVMSLSSRRTLEPKSTARLVRDITEARRSGFEVALVCSDRVNLEYLRRTHVHRFVDVLPTRSAAFRYFPRKRPSSVNAGTPEAA